MEKSGEEWRGVHRCGEEWSGEGRNGEEWRGEEWSGESGEEWRGVGRSGEERNGVKRIEGKDEPLEHSLRDKQYCKKWYVGCTLCLSLLLLAQLDSSSVDKIHHSLLKSREKVVVVRCSIFWSR